MDRPSEIDKAFTQLKPNFKLLKQLFKKQQKAYIRQRLKAIKWLWQGKSRQEVVDTPIQTSNSTNELWCK